MTRQASRTAANSRGEVNILMVEDEDTLRHSVARMLRKEGFSVIEASDGTVALDFLRKPKDTIDVLLLDVSLPGASSREVLEEAERLIPGIRVIVTSAYSREKAAAYLVAEMEVFLQKPYRIGDLVDLIRNSEP